MKEGAVLSLQLFVDLLNAYTVGGQFQTLSLPTQVGVERHVQRTFFGKVSQVELVGDSPDQVVVVSFAWLLADTFTWATKEDREKGKVANCSIGRIVPYPFYFLPSRYRWHELGVRSGLVSFRAMPVAGEADGRFITLIPDNDADAVRPDQLGLLLNSPLPKQIDA